MKTSLCVGLCICVHFYGSLAEKSLLKVAICDPGPDPYSIRLQNGSLIGFDPGDYQVIDCLNLNALLIVLIDCRALGPDLSNHEFAAAGREGGINSTVGTGDHDWIKSTGHNCHVLG